MPGFDWFAQLPEITTGKLQSGPQSGPMLAAAASYEAQAANFTAQAAVMAAAIAETASHWEGMASIRSTEAALKMPAWLADAAVTAATHGLKAANQAAAYQTAFAAVPQLPTIAENHITRAVLHATNFLGINTVPIGIKEADYWVRMRAQAGAAMLSYLSSTTANVGSLIPTMVPMPIAVPGAGIASVMQSGMMAMAGGTEAARRDATLALNTATSMASTAKLTGTNLAAFGNDAERKAEQAATTAMNASQQASQSSQATTAQDPAQMAQTMAPLLSQGASQAGSLPQQALQAPMQAGQQFMSPLQQFSQLFSNGFGKDATGADVTQVGLFGTEPESTHPLAGGMGPAAGAGMLSGGGVPGNPGAAARTPLLASVSAPPSTATTPTATPAAVADSKAMRAGAAPMGMMPMTGARGQQQAGGTVDELVAPGALEFDNDDDDIDDWG
ncbi:putative PPE family immunogenic protein PPE68 (plasmid) [Mycobacterium sp. THAF192]|nr:putative PPE family immunogenic protein PPE68 [Mycobacterium sp. THAF192]